MDSIIIYELLLPTIVKLLESEQFHQDLILISKSKLQESSESTENQNNNNFKSMKAKKAEKSNQKLNESHKAYLMILVILPTKTKTFKYLENMM